MLKNLHGKVYYIEVESYEEADKIIEIFQSIPTFARNCIGITTGYDTDNNKLYVYTYILKDGTKMLLGPPAFRGELYKQWEWVKRKYYTLKRKGEL